MMAVLAVVKRSKIPMIRTDLFLEERDERYSPVADHMMDCLRRMIKPLFLPATRGQRIGGLVLSPGTACRAAANDFLQDSAA